MKYLLCCWLLFTSITAFGNPLPETLIFAVQPHDALRIKQDQHDNNIIMKLAKALKVNIEIYECPWARCLKAIESGQADVVDDLFFSNDRAEYTHFLKPSFETQLSGYRFYANNTHTPLIKTWDDLKNKRIGVLRGYKHFPKFDESKELIKVDLLDLDVIIKLILKGRLDVFISPPSFNETSIAKTDLEHKITKQPFSHIEPIPLYIGLSKKSAWAPFQAQLEQALNDIVNNQTNAATN